MVSRSTFSAIFLTTLALLCGCGSTPEIVLDLRSDPVGAQVYLSRRGEKSIQADLGPLEGDVKSEPYEEEFRLIGTSPMIFVSPLEEAESKAKILGFGGAVMRKYREAVIRFQKDGFQTIERHVRFYDGEFSVAVTMDQEPAGTP